ncbi:MAG: T9SS type A sorting domain-containing protein [Muribaculaceae bacterium]|nr:T9SS type A sorting domain-containing protein [Muribaculaceae bacterium]
MCINCNASACQLTVSDLSGRNICRTAIDDNLHQLPALSKGVYIITLHKEGKTSSILKITVK